MKKKLFLAILLCSIIVTSGCRHQDGDSFTLKGKIGVLDAPAKVYFSYYADGEEHSDSAVIKKGVFSFSGAVTAPSASRIILDYTGKGMIDAAQKGNIYYLYIEPGLVKFKSPDSLQNIKFIKSPINDEHQAYLKEIGGQIQDLAAKMNLKHQSATPEQRNDTAFISSLNREYRALLDERREKQLQYIKKHPDLYFSIVALTESTPPNFDVKEIEPLFLSIDEKHRETTEGKAFAARINAAKSITIGEEAPNFTQNDPEGNPVKLSDFRGKYVLIDFWASWCGPCRQENPNLVKAYAKYKEKGFEILGVSLDNKDGKQAWVNAIEKDGLTWTQVSDLKSWSNEVAVLYGIRAVPQNYLIDPDGIIVASNLKGEKLEEYLSTLF